MPVDGARHARFVVVRVLMARRAAQPGDSQSVSSAPYSRLMRAAIVALARAIVRDVAIPAAWMKEHLAGLDEERDRASRGVADAGEGIGAAEGGSRRRIGSGWAPTRDQAPEGERRGGSEPEPGRHREHDGAPARRVAAISRWCGSHQPVAPEASRAKGRRRTERPVSASSALPTAGAIGARRAHRRRSAAPPTARCAPRREASRRFSEFGSRGSLIAGRAHPPG